MAESIILPENFNVANLTFGAPRALDSGGKSIPVYLNGRPIVVQIPEMSAPYGLGKWPKEDSADLPPKYDLSLSFRGLDTRESLKSTYKMFSDMEDAIVSKAFADSLNFFKKRHTSRDVVKELFTPIIKIAKDKNGEPTDKYPPTVNLKLPFKDGKFQFLVYNNHQEEIDLNSVTIKGSKVLTIIQCSGLWVAGAKFGCSWKVKQMQVTPPASITGYAFKKTVVEEVVEDDVLSDEDVAPTTTVPAASAPVSAQAAAQVEDSDEDEMSEEEEPKPKKVPVKKAASKK